jgi:deazaflavin-dependent oxidoreductase (nitroreductase family)
MTLKRSLARFNRTVANRVVGPAFARLPGFGMVHHLGRRSGREYRTPVKVFRRGAQYVITLPYGADSDWVRNVIAAGGCGLVVGRRRIRLVEPVLFTDDGTVEIPRLLHRVLSRMKVTQFFALDQDTRQPRSDRDETVELTCQNSAEPTT